MPRYFFDIECDGIAAEKISADLPDVVAAHEYVKGYAEIVGPTPADLRDWNVIIKDGDGKLVQTVVLN